MANPFYRGQWIPIRHGYYPQASVHPLATKPKVVNIPVQFFCSNEDTGNRAPASSPTMETKSAAAVKIQKAVRGFLVRKNARVVRRIAAEVNDIERKVKEEEDRIRVDAKERLRITEALMSLLLRLDSVRGVRDFRKKVIRRVIGLQEAIDSISGEAQEPGTSTDEAAAREESRGQGESLDEEEKDISTADGSTDGKGTLTSVNFGNGCINWEVDGDASMSVVAEEVEGSIGEAAGQISPDRVELADQSRTVEVEKETIPSSERKSNLDCNETSDDLEVIDTNSSANDVSLSQEQVHPQGSTVEAAQLETSMGLEVFREYMPQNTASSIESGYSRQTLDILAEVLMKDGSIDRKRDLAGVEGNDESILTEADGDVRKGAFAEEREEPRGIAAEQIAMDDVEPMDQKPTVKVEMEMIPEMDSSLDRIETSDDADVIDPNSEATCIDVSNTSGGTAQLDASMVHDVLECDGKSNASIVEMKDNASRSLEAASEEERREMMDVMQRMAVENETLKAMVAELCSRSAQQCRLVEGLVGRVEQLERVVQRMENRRKKRRSGAACTALSSTK